MFWQILHMESGKVFRRWMLWSGLGLALIPGLIFFFVSFYVARQTVAPVFVTWPGGVITMLAWANGFFSGTGYAVYFLAILIGVIAAQEYSWRTMQLWLSNGVSRWQLMLAKFAISVLATFLVSLVFLLVGALLSLVFGAQMPGGIKFQVGDIGLALLVALRTGYGMLPYVALALLLIVAFRSMVAVVGVPIFMLAIELPLSIILPALGPTGTGVAHYIPAGLAQSLNAQNYAALKLPLQSLGGGGLASPLMSVIGVAVYTLVLFGLAAWLFQRQDLAN